MLRANNLEYRFESEESAISKSCRVSLALINLSAPEGVNFKLLAVRGKVQKVTFIGFSLDVGDMVFVNGLPMGMQKATLSSAVYESSSFTSAGRLNGGPIDDGGIMVTTGDMGTADAFLGSFWDGSFTLSFVRTGTTTTRSYQVTTAPPSDVRKRFFECISTFRGL
jgi:hypothetical protein